MVNAIGPNRMEEIAQSPGQMQGLLDLIRVLLATNAALRGHCQRVADHAQNALGGMKQTLRHLHNLTDFAAFREPPAGGDEDEE